MNSKWFTGLSAVVVSLAAFFAHVSPKEGAPQRIEVEAKRFDFTPAEITVKKGSPVTILLISKDVDHGLKFKTSTSC